ncbi:MAG TPA: proline--tRNA ligase [Phycisphaerae bacterium]
MLWSEFFIPTLKEVPSDAVVPSHQLMLRAGLIRQVAAGSYSYLPLGFRVLQKVVQIVREEMNAAGAIELLMPAMQPVEWWEQTGRTTAMGPTLMRLPDQPWRKGTVLGPTHEEVITEIVRAYINSYKQLPINLYQIQTKFRDEERPKSGVLRTREFLMKDAYSFHTDKLSLDEGYRKMYDAYCRIFARCGLPYIAVEAESGPIGGDASHEFMVVTEAGEDYIARAADGSYAANLERAVPAAIADSGPGQAEALREVHTPGFTTIEQVSKFLGCRPQDMIKTIIYRVEPGGMASRREPGSRAETSACIPAARESMPPSTVAVLVRGDHEVNESKLRRVLDARPELADPALIRQLTGAEVGFAGPVGLKARMIVDQAVTVMHNAITGANKTDYHLMGVNPGRDFPLSGADIIMADVRFAATGDRAPNGSPLVFEKCIEVGHVFKLGTKYSDSMKAHFLDEHGAAHPLIMGCYGIGINRIMAAAIEAGHDDAGICWPLSIAPFAVIILALDLREEQVMSVARKLHDDLTARGIDVLLDNRDARPGFKFKDADLIGIPIRITVGKKGLTDGVVELKQRRAAEVIRIAPESVVQRVLELMQRGG